MKEVILSHYGFSRLPFGKETGPQDMFQSDALTQASAMLELGIESEDIIVPTGPIGCGKSLTVRYAARGFDPNRYQLMYLRGNLMHGGELIKLVLQGMKINPPHSTLKAKPVFSPPSRKLPVSRSSFSMTHRMHLPRPC
jgi:type II secretory pathway predicted ATPase ExeA